MSIVGDLAEDRRMSRARCEVEERSVATTAADFKIQSQFRVEAIFWSLVVRVP